MEGVEPRTIVAGIDEAGYGPLLGPLVVSATAFEMPPGIAKACLWRVLRRSVSRTLGRSGRRIPVLDSKRLYHREQGLGRLERSVLAFSSTRGGDSISIDAWLGGLCSHAVETLRPYPWYGERGRCLPIAADPRSIRIAAEGLRRDLEANGVRFAGCWTEILPEGHFNRLVDRTRNKAMVLQGLVLRLIQRIADAYPTQALGIDIDKQGARSFYAQALLRAFDGRRLRVIEETESSSCYEMVLPQSPPVRVAYSSADDCGWPSAPREARSAEGGGRPAAAGGWRVRFVESGESKHLPIALASMISKYVRELLMTLFNDHWCSRVENLKSTAGYYQDGLRFLGDLRPHLGRLGVNEEQLVRRHSGVEKANAPAGT